MNERGKTSDWAFGNASFQVIDCTGTNIIAYDKRKNMNKNTQKPNTVKT